MERLLENRLFGMSARDYLSCMESPLLINFIVLFIASAMELSGFQEERYDMMKSFYIVSTTLLPVYAGILVYKKNGEILNSITAGAIYALLAPTITVLFGLLLGYGIDELENFQRYYTTYLTRSCVLAPLGYFIGMAVDRYKTGALPRKLIFKK
ncbi:MAG: hypothetical protein PHG85_01520 [Candidatus Altiarchaeota archaeon]|nr:hypothetical protein [Candidatus Altiarchaeota archaeon]